MDSDEHIITNPLPFTSDRVPLPATSVPYASETIAAMVGYLLEANGSDHVTVSYIDLYRDRGRVIFIENADGVTIRFETEAEKAARGR